MPLTTGHGPLTTNNFALATLPRPVLAPILDGIAGQEAFALDVGSLPRLTRHTYRVEVLHMALWGGLVAMLEGGIAAVIVAKTFHGTPFQISVVRATPVVTNMLSIIWGMMAVTRPKIPLLTIACTGAAVAMAATALVPADYSWSAWMFAAQMVIARIFLSGTATLRTAIWKANYPTAVRGRLAGRLQLQGSLSRLATLYLVSSVLDLAPGKANLWVPRILVDWLGLDASQPYWQFPHWLVEWGGPNAYRWIYPLLALLGGVSILLLQLIRVRGDRQLNRQMLETGELGPISLEARAVEPYSLTAVLNPALAPLRRMVEILKRDKAFRVYQTAQMFSGAANLLIDPILVIIFVNQLGMNYTSSTAMLDMLPIVLSLATITLWARLYDRWGLPKYRVINGGFWTIRMILTAVAVACTQYLLDMPHGREIVIGIFVFAQVLNGIAQGGGGIAWNLGHLHFARPEEAELYMGIHATLTGLRGWLGFVGAPLYVWGGWPVFAAAAVMSLIGFVLYFYGMTTRFGLGGVDVARTEAVAARQG